MKFTILMAIYDYIPVLLFGYGALTLGICFYSGMKKFEFAMFSAGGIDVVAAGALKATWKFLYAANICDFEKLNAVFFPLQTLGFVLLALGICSLVVRKRKGTKLMAIAPIVPPVFSGTMLFVVLMILGVLGMDVALGILSVKLKKPLALILTIFSFVFLLGMGYLSSKDFSQAYMNWIAQTVNILGQGAFMAAAIILKNAGLKEVVERYG